MAGTLGMARRELEELYSGIPDESVNLTFQDFAQLPTAPAAAAAADHSRKAITSSNSNKKNNHLKSSSSALSKLPSLDFNKAFEEASINIHHHSSKSNNHDQHRKFYSSFMDHYGEEAALHTSHLGTSTDRTPPQDSNYNVSYGHGNHNHHHHHQAAAASGVMGLKSHDHHHDIMSGGTSSMMMSNNFMDSFQGGSGRRRRPGIPHSNICSICSVYIYMFRNNRCLVCGRVYCRQCVSIGMGEMTEGRKCIQCLGKRFSQRYIDRAGKAGGGGCCMGFLDSSSTTRARQREMEWAEKGPRKSSSNGNHTNTTTTAATPSRNYNNYSTASTTTSTPTHGGHHAHRAAPPDFSRSSSPSPYSPYNTHSPASSYHFPL